MKLVKISNGIHKGVLVNGLFELLGSGRDAQGIWIDTMLNGEPARITSRPPVSTIEIAQVGISKAPAALEVKISDDELKSLITEKFGMITVLVGTLRDSDINSLTIAGASGIGKTWNVEEYLEEAERKSGQHWMTIGGNCSPFGLYEALYETRYKGSILVLDDVDVFSDEISLNIFKKALDTTKRRIIDWRSAAKILDDRGLPDSFEFHGKVIFLTNRNILREISRGSKLSEHLGAVITRGAFLDLGVHDIRSIWIYVKSVIEDKNYLVKRGLTPTQQQEVVDWLQDNLNQLIKLSLRTPLMITEYMKYDINTWESKARHTLLEQISLTD